MASEMTSGFNGNATGSGDGNGAGVGGGMNAASSSATGGGMYAASSSGTGGEMYAASTSGTSFEQQQNGTIDNNMNMLEAGNQSYQLDTPGNYILLGDDIFDSDDGNDNAEDAFGDDQAEIMDGDYSPVGSQRKRYHRHSQAQIAAMENFYQECPHPDEKQRQELADSLNLTTQQVKFWFQNKRTQVKAQQERAVNQELRAENERLKLERARLQEAWRNSMNCRSCSGQKVLNVASDEEKLRTENQRLRQEIDRVSAIATGLVGKPYLSFAGGVPTLVPAGAGGDIGGQNLLEQQVVREVQEAADVFRSATVSADIAQKSYRFGIALQAMTEVMALTEANTPLWIPSENGTTMTINYQDYLKRFPDGLVLPPPGFKFEASRATAIIMMNHISLVEMFMNVNRWSSMFAPVVSRAGTTEVLSYGAGGTYHGLVNLMVAEFHLPTPTVPTRSDFFARCCKKQRDGLWYIADVSLGASPPSPLRRFRRRPSGCAIQGLANGCSLVTWVEHVEVDDRFVHQLYKPLVSSTLAFGAQRWLGTLQRQCERQAYVSASFSNEALALMGVANQDGRRSMMRLAARLVRSYHQGVSSTTAHEWTIVSGSGADNVRIMSRKSIDETGRPSGLVLCASTSFWVPVPQQTLFNFFCNVFTRWQWDTVIRGGLAQDLVHIGTGGGVNNCVSLFRISGTNDPELENMMIIQESCTDALGSSVIWAPLGGQMLDGVLAGGDSDYVPILPAGICILPDGTRRLEDRFNEDVNATGGSLLNVAFQLVANTDPHARVNLGEIATMNGLITSTVDSIKACVTEIGVVNNNNNAFAFANNVNLENYNAGVPDGFATFQG